MTAVKLLADGLDVDDLVAWISGIPLTDWPAGDLSRLRPAMVTDPTWHGFAGRTNPLVAGVMVALLEDTYLDRNEFVERNRWLSVVMPGDRIEPHRDAAEPGWCTRIHVPLVTNEAAPMVADGVPYRMAVGSVYLFDKRSEHAVVNDGPTPRIHLMFDVLEA